MSAILVDNIDRTYSLHMKEKELEVLVVLLTLFEKTDSAHSKAVTNLTNAFRDTLGAKFDKIDREVWVTLNDGEDDETSKEGQWYLTFED